MPLLRLPAVQAEDLPLLESCDSSVRFRRFIEILVVRKLLDVVIEAGYDVTVDDGEEFPVERSTDRRAILDAVFAVDECCVTVRCDDGRAIRAGRIFLVLGNSGWDSISDHSAILEDLLAPVNEYAEQLSEWM